jgi:DNA repair ATPase RecN
MDQVSNQSTNSGTKRPRNRRNKKEISPVSQIDETAARLNTHEQVCAERYKAIEGRMDNIETRMDAISSDVKDLKQTNDKQFNEIKALLEKRYSSSHQALITAAGTIIVALVGFLGYLLTHIK